MSGIVQAFLTDDELDTLVRWGEEMSNAGLADDDHSRHLLGKLRGMAQSVSCKPCREGGSCKVPGAVTPADVIV
jgi:hypothetical protein